MTKANVSIDGDQAFAVEQHGIDHIPETERRGSPVDLAWLWAGANINVPYIVLGGLLLGLGLTMHQMLAVVLIGNLSFLFVGMGSVPGARAGTATLVIGRASFGRKGGVIPATVAKLTVVGWEAVNIVLGIFALFAFFSLVGIPLGLLGKVLALGALVAVTFCVAILGHATIETMQRIFTWVLGAVILYVLFQVAGTKPATTIKLVAGADFKSLLIGFSLVTAMPASYATVPAEYARYLPRNTSARAITIWTALGGFVPAVLITMIGYLAANATGIRDPLAEFQPLLPAWLFGAFLLTVVAGTIANNFVTTYSSGMALLAMGVKVTRPVAIMLDAVLATTGAAYAIFFHDFTDIFVSFLSLSLIWIAPWWAIYLVDARLREDGYCGDEMLSGGGGRYRFRNGWRLEGMGSWVIGMLAALFCSANSLFVSPFAKSVLQGADLTVPAGMVIAGTSYWLSTRSKAV